LKNERGKGVSDRGAMYGVGLDEGNLFFVCEQRRSSLCKFWRQFGLGVRLRGEALRGDREIDAPVHRGNLSGLARDALVQFRNRGAHDWSGSCGPPLR